MEDFFKYHRDEFDVLEPAPDAWERLQQARQVQPAARIVLFRSTQWLKIAAAVVFVSSMALFWWQQEMAVQ